MLSSRRSFACVGRNNHSTKKLFLAGSKYVCAIYFKAPGPSPCGNAAREGALFGQGTAVVVGVCVCLSPLGKHHHRCLSIHRGRRSPQMPGSEALIRSFICRWGGTILIDSFLVGGK